eukprot:TRINITY_DN59912_c0_g1_i1.p1 TRINITY_DN59912_c0_g1~~TRINITY_DN59912_c0_g1_i1.p1  ORF type:complete len:542 (+),score=97.85 TRINITY_DN59912_c0_g1_i1:77-1627(+)
MPKTTTKKTVMKAKKVATSAKMSKLLLSKGRVSKDVIHKATKMTREQWLELQKGMEAKWPLPEYMKGEKGHMQFKSETFTIVTCWTKDTKIQYRPHAKAPGSKSHIRYEKYSKARTVGEALELNTYPADWCWDYERGFIRVLGGKIREEPLNISKCKESEISAVDRAIHTWYKRELSRKLGIPLAELAVNAGCSESLDDRASRLLAQRGAKEALEKAEKEGRMITDEEMLGTLRRWSFMKNPFRQNVMQKGQTWVYSDTLGLLRDRQGDLHLSPATRKYPQVAELFSRWLTDRLPVTAAKDFTFTSMNVNCNYAAAQHRDAGNFGSSFIAGFGDFTGGKLFYYPEDPGAPTPMEKGANAKSKKMSVDINKNLFMFNGNCAHYVEPFKGDRYSIVWFTLGCHAKMSAEDKDKLTRLGMPLPALDAKEYTVLCAPANQRKEGTEAQEKKRPTHLSYAKTGLKRKPMTPAAAKALAKTLGARRLKPEDKKSFYTTEHRRSKASTAFYRAGGKVKKGTKK